jgi:hypothetical protein
MGALMMASLVASAIAASRLRILVFGPTPAPSALSDPLSAGLRKKRIEIRTELLSQGHIADFPEDLIDLSQPPPFDNPWFQEQLLMKQYDLIVVLIGSPGSNVELGAISIDPSLCRKAQLFLCQDHAHGGLPHQACNLAATFDAQVKQFVFPDDIDACHLLGAIESIVNKLQAGKILVV